MSGSSITMMVISMLILWGGLVVAIINLLRHDTRAGHGADPTPGVGTGSDRLTRDL